MSTTFLMPPGRARGWTNAGVPAAGCLLYTYEAGTSTPKATYADAAKTTPHTNPVVLDAKGEALIYWDGNYKVDLRTAAGVQITGYPIDNFETPLMSGALAAADGAGMMGFLYATAYGANTVGKWLKDLALGTGATFIGFLQAGTGTVLRSLHDKMRETVSVTDFMSAAERADALTGTPALDTTAAFIAAIAAADVVNIPPGTYLVGTIPINKNNFTLRGSGYNKCTLKATADALTTIDVANLNSVSFLVLEDFKLQGNATNLGGIKLGSSDTNYCAGAMLNRVGVWDYSRAIGTNGFGIQLACVQNLSIHNCWVYRNRHQYQRVAGTGYATSAHITGKTGYIGGGYIGMYIDSQIDDLYIDDNVIEGNSNSAIVVTAAAVAVGRGSSIYINGAYLEANNATGAGVIYVTGSAGAYQNHVVVVDRCNFAVNTGYYITFDRVIATVKNNKIDPSQVSTTANTSVHFDSNRYPSAADFLTTYRALPGNITVRDTNDPATGVTPNQINLVNAVTFPSTARPVDDPYTLDDYREGTWTPVLSSDGVAPTYTNVDAATGTYTKIGNLVFVRCVIRADITAVGSGTPYVTGLPFASKGLEPPAIGLSTALTTVAGTEYVVAGPAVVFNGAAYVVLADCYLVFTVTYQVA